MFLPLVSFPYSNLAVLGKRKVKLQLGAKAVVVLGCPTVLTVWLNGKKP